MAEVIGEDAGSIALMDAPAEAVIANMPSPEVLITCRIREIAANLGGVCRRSPACTTTCAESDGTDGSEC